MTTHKDRQLSQKIIVYERSDNPREGGYAPVCNSQGSTTRSKMNESLLKGLVLFEKGVYPNM